MSLEDDLLRKGYLPEGVPPFLSTASIADYFQKNPLANYLTKAKSPRLRAATYNASKRGMTRRPFSAVHPVTAHDLNWFVSIHLQQLEALFSQSSHSLSVPKHDASASRAIVIASHSELEKERMARLAGYRFIAKTDISRFYHSVYTHSVPWPRMAKRQARQTLGLNQRASIATS